MARMIALSILVALVRAASANELPNVVDLKAAYCVPVVQWTIQAFGEVAKTHPPIRSHLAEQEANLRRLQLYLAPRTPNLDPVAVTAARKAGEEDVQRATKQGAECTARCSNAECLRSCTSEDGDLIKRMGECHKVAWLPT